MLHLNYLKIDIWFRYVIWHDMPRMFRSINFCLMGADIVFECFFPERTLEVL